MAAKRRLAAGAAGAIGLMALLAAVIVTLQRYGSYWNTTPGLAPVWDWTYVHHVQLGLVVAVAVVVVAVAAGAVALRRRSLGYGIACALPALVAIVVVVAAWVVADQRSNASDIERRLHQVTATLPRTPTRTAVRAGDNFLIESYVVDGNISAVAAAVQNSMHLALDRLGLVYNTPAPGGPPPDINVTFTGRNGCDGSVDILVAFTRRDGTTAIDVTGHCED